jgi:hypothetical protein
MGRECDVFQKFHDGSTHYRASVTGKFEPRRKRQMLGEHSESEFFAIDIQAVEHLRAISTRSMRPLAKEARTG